ncbi:MAG TPA: response regulator [Gemmataceae bacterium]|jgi:PAS domain S-box-containing protein|nr:response regulator [Gemmataceae bacterium]
MVKQANPCILIVEDDPGMTALEQRRLERAGYGAITALSADEALGKLKECHVDLILLDYRLPGSVDGLDFYTQVKTAGFDVPVILVTAYSNEAIVIRALRSGVRDFVAKSVEFLDYLPEAVERVLRQVRLEHELADSETRLASVIDSAMDAIITIDADNRVTLFNHAAEKMFRCSAAEALGQPIISFLTASASEGPPFPRPFGESGRSSERTDCKGKRADGEQFPVEASISYARVGGQKICTIIARDVTERKRMERALRESKEQFLQAQKMEAVGRLAGGVAHDFNNLLTVITGFCDILLRTHALQDPSRVLVEEIQKAGERAALLTRQLLAFGRKQMLLPQVLSFNVVVADMDRMLRRIIGEDVELTTVLGPGLGSVLADKGQIGQVILNLVVNARDAMPRGGKLTIETADVFFDQAYVATHPDVRVGPHVMLAVADTGVGMSEEVRAHVFEPFFTTKEVGKGSGLGLATVFGIVKQSGGHIAVYSEPGHGTTFKIYFPMVGEKTREIVAEVPVNDVPLGQETILLVEDADPVRALAREVLQKCGYTIMEARHGRDALRLAEHFAGTIDLLLTDVVMPQMGGPELANTLRAQRPSTRVMYMSGYTDDAIFRHGLLEGETAFIQKPFAMEALARKVREVLDR